MGLAPDKLKRHSKKSNKSPLGDSGCSELPPGWRCGGTACAEQTLGHRTGSGCHPQAGEQHRSWMYPACSSSQPSLCYQDKFEFRGGAGAAPELPNPTQRGLRICHSTKQPGLRSHRGDKGEGDGFSGLSHCTLRKTQPGEERTAWTSPCPS